MPFPVLPAFSYRRVERRAVREGRLEDERGDCHATVLAIVLYTGVARVLLYLFPPGTLGRGLTVPFT